MLKPAATSRKPLSLGVVFLTIFIDLVGFSIIFPLFPAILEHYGQSGLLRTLEAALDRFGEATGAGERFTPVLFGGVLGSLYATLQFFFAPLWGSLSDRYGRRSVLLVTISGTLLSYLIWIFAGNFVLLVLARLLGGAMSGNLSVATAAVADITTAENRSKGMGVIGVAFGLGFVIGPAIGGVSAQIDPLAHFPELARWGLNPFSFVALVAASLALVNLLWIVSRFSESLPSQGPAVPRLPPNPLKRLLQPLPALARKTNFAYLVYMFAFSGMEFTLSFLGVERFAYGVQEIALMMVFVGFVLILTQGGLVRRLAPLLGERRVATIGLGAVAAGLLVLAAAQTVLVLYVGLAVLALGAGLCSPTFAALVSLYSGPEAQGKALGAFRSIGSLGRAVGPLGASAVFWWFGSAQLYVGCACLVAAAAFLAARLPQPDKAPAKAAVAVD